MTILVVVAVTAERDAVLRDVRDPSHVVVEAVGVGPVLAAATTARLLAHHEFDVVISAGIGGGFPQRAAVGDVVVASASVAADIGCRTEAGFLTVTDMGLEQTSRVAFDRGERWAKQLENAGLRTRTGDILTLSCMTGTDADAAALAKRHPDAIAEAMEGWGIAVAAADVGVPCGEVRAISNLIGRRDPSTWDLPGSLDALARAFGVLLSEPLP